MPLLLHLCIRENELLDIGTFLLVESLNRVLHLLRELGELGERILAVLLELV